MDEAETRRGESAVHIKWNRDQAILSGDIMFAMSHELLVRSEVKGIRSVHELFSKTAKEVCIGQQMDMDFEQRDDVTEEEYLEMICLKTSVLIGASAAMAAIAADCSEERVEALYSFGENIGLSFQIQDDILDAFGESAAVGKRIGGDILNNKKTFLYLKAKKSANPVSRAELEKWFSIESDSQEKIDSVKKIMKESGALAEVRKVQEEHIHKAIDQLKKSGISGAWYDELESLALHQLERSF
jgi:geranylgeranyl diphosphate synthase type II